MAPYPDNRFADQPDPEARKAQGAMSTLGYYGLVPFIFGAALVWFSPWLIGQKIALITARGTLVYGGIIAAYMAGMIAGRALHKGLGGLGAYLPSMIATLIAWAMVLPDGYFFFSLGLVWRLLILVGVFGWLYLKDNQLAMRGDWPKWYGRLRLRLTAWVVILLSTLVARLLLWGYI